MKHYITPDNQLYGFDNTQTDLIPPDAIEIPDTITTEQISYVDFNNGNPIFNQEKYDIDNQKKLLQQDLKNSALNKLKTLGLSDDEIKALLL